MRDRIVLTAALFAAIMLAAPPLRAQNLRLPKAVVDYDDRADFKSFHTFQWKDSQDPLPDPARNMAMVTSIERELEKKGLTKPPGGGGDLRVRFYASMEKKVRGTGRQDTSWTGDLQTSVDFEKMAEGTLIIELYDAGTEKRVWRGTTTSVFRPGSLDESDIRSAVALVLGKYPPAPASPAP
jgi:Domain of unknown function (DUF4136)